MRQGHKKPNTQENQQHHACHDKQNLADADASGYLPTVQARLLVGRHIMPALPTLDMRYRNGHVRIEFFHRIPPAGCKRVTPSKIKKADVAEHPQAFGHVGLLCNAPPGHSRRVALHLVVRLIRPRYSIVMNGECKRRCRKPLILIRLHRQNNSRTEARILFENAGYGPYASINAISSCFTEVGRPGEGEKNHFLAGSGTDVTVHNHDLDAHDLLDHRLHDRTGRFNQSAAVKTPWRRTMRTSQSR